MKELTLELFDESKIEIVEKIKGKIIDEIIKESFEKILNFLRIEKEKIEEIVRKLKRYLEETRVQVKRNLEKNALGEFSYDPEDARIREINISYSAYKDDKEIVLTFAEELFHAVQRFFAYISKISNFLFKELKNINYKKFYYLLSKGFEKYSKWILFQPKNYEEYLKNSLEIEAKEVSKRIAERFYSQKTLERMKCIAEELKSKVIEKLKEYLKENVEKILDYLKKSEIYIKEKMRSNILSKISKKYTLAKVYLKEDRSEIYFSSLLFFNPNFFAEYFSKSFSFVLERLLNVKESLKRFFKFLYSYVKPYSVEIFKKYKL
jgi:hypothetical protein